MVHFPQISSFTGLFCLQPLELAAFSLPVGTAGRAALGAGDGNAAEAM